MPLTLDQQAEEAAKKYCYQNAGDFDHNGGRKDQEEMAVAAKAAFLAGWQARGDAK